MTLLASNCVFGILFAQLLSIMFLDEKFIILYDLPALILLPAGTIMIVLVSNKDPRTITADDIEKYIISSRTLIVAGTLIFFWIGAELSMRWMFKALDNFYEDAEEDDQRTQM